MTTKAIHTEAEIIEEPQSSLVLTQVTPGLTIEGNFAALKAYVDQTVADYVGVVVADEYVPQAKRDRAALNGLVKDIDARRLEVKRMFTAPVTEFENRIKDILAPAKEASAAIDIQIKEFEERERLAKRDELEKHWRDYAGALADAVSFEQIEDPKWALKSTNLMAAFEAIEARVEKIATDEATLTDLALPYESEAKATYLTTLDLSAAIARNKAMVEARERADALEAEKRAYAAQREAEQAEQSAQESMPQTVVAAPEPEAIADDIPMMGEAVVLTPVEDTSDWTFQVHCTRAQVEQIAAFAKSIGLTGRAVRS